MTDNVDLQKILTTDLEYIAALDTMIDNLDKTIILKAIRHNRKHYEALQTMPGCGVATALTILYETHTIQRFRTPQRFSSYSRVVRAANESAGKDLGSTSNDKIGNPYLKWAFAEVGQSMIKNYPEICAWRRNLAAVHGKAKAHARLRHKIAVAVYFMLKHDKVFDMKRFLGNSKDQTENPSQQWAETSGQQSEPILATENPSGRSKKRHYDQD
jgi:transposase